MMLWKYGNIQSLLRLQRGAILRKAMQSKAWKGGHKIACKDLGPKFRAWGDDLLVVDSHHDVGVLDGISLNAEIDYNCLDFSHSTEPTTCSDTRVRSMANFYKRLVRVIRGEWWLYGDSVQFPFHVGGTGYIEDDLVQAFVFEVCSSLCFDVTDIDEGWNWNSEATVERNIARFGGATSREEFLALNTSYPEAQRATVRKHSKTVALKHFRNTQHASQEEVKYRHDPLHK
jgi:hypothetical protein